MITDVLYLQNGSSSNNLEWKKVLSTYFVDIKDGSFYTDPNVGVFNFKRGSL